MKLLIADDDPQLVRALRITLAAHGYQVIPASDGAEAIERYGPRARKHRPIRSLPPEFDHRRPAPSRSGPGIGF